MKKCISIVNIFLLVISIIISSMIFSNKEIKFNALKSVFEAFSNYINIGKHTSTVSSFNYFVYISNNKYYNVSNSIHSPTKGTIIDYSDDSLLIKCDNNYYAYFENIINIEVSYLDVVDPSFSLANFIEDFTFYFIKGSTKFTYEEVMANN